MSFIAILLSIAFELGIKSLEGWRRFDWFTQLTDWVQLQMQKTSFSDGPIGLLAILAPVVLGTWIVYAMLMGLWFLFGFAFSVFVLTMALGPVDPMRQASDYLHAMQAGDQAEADRHAAALLDRPADDNPVVTAQQVKETLLIRMCENILGVFLWFILLGPVGAVLFRATCLLQLRFAGVQSGLTDAINDLYRILMWIPARLTAVAFALVGNFVETLQSLDHFSDLWKRDSQGLLIEAGLGAVPGGQHDDNQPDLVGVAEVLALVKRAILAWLTVLGALVIVGWLI